MSLGILARLSACPMPPCQHLTRGERRETTVLQHVRYWKSTGNPSVPLTTPLHCRHEAIRKSYSQEFGALKKTKFPAEMCKYMHPENMVYALSELCRSVKLFTSSTTQQVQMVENFATYF